MDRASGLIASNLPLFPSNAPRSRTAATMLLDVGSAKRRTEEPSAGFVSAQRMLRAERSKPQIGSLCLIPCPPARGRLTPCRVRAWPLARAPIPPSTAAFGSHFGACEALQSTWRSPRSTATAPRGLLGEVRVPAEARRDIRGTDSPGRTQHLAPGEALAAESSARSPGAGHGARRQREEQLRALSSRPYPRARGRCDSRLRS